MMKTYKKLKWSQVIIVGLLSILLAACGSDNNGDIDQGLGNGYYGDNIYNPNAGGIEGEIAALMQANQCGQGGSQRIFYKFHQPGVTDPNNLLGPWTQGPAAGQVLATHVGINAFNDILIVRKIGSGSQTLAFDIELALCPYQGLFIPGRQATGLTAAPGINIAGGSTCSFGPVSTAGMYIHLAAFQGFQPFQQYLNFAAIPGCN